MRLLVAGQQRAQALVWLTVLMPLLLGISGLAIDGAVVFTARRELQSVADGAARAAATRVDQVSLRQSGGDRMELVQGQGGDSAWAAANGYLDERAAVDSHWRTRLRWRIAVLGPRVDVAVDADVPTAFMRIVGYDSVSVGATSSANVRHGIGAPL